MKDAYSVYLNIDFEQIKPQLEKIIKRHVLQRSVLGIIVGVVWVGKSIRISGYEHTWGVGPGLTLDDINKTALDSLSHFNETRNITVYNNTRVAYKILIFTTN